MLCAGSPVIFPELFTLLLRNQSGCCGGDLFQGFDRRE